MAGGHTHTRRQADRRTQRKRVRARERDRESLCTIITSETELMDRMYMVTPTVTGVPAKNAAFRLGYMKGSIFLVPTFLLVQR
jgi:hypothetical protein